MTPEFEVPAVSLRCGLVCKAERIERVINGIDKFGRKDAFISQPGRRPGSKNVDEKNADRRNEPAHPAGALGVLLLLCGRCVHAGKDNPRQETLTERPTTKSQGYGEV